MPKEEPRDFESPEYKAFRFGVFARDNYTCQLTGQRGGELQAHHIKKWSTNPDLRFVVSNGITLSKEAHDMVTGNEDKYETMFRNIVKKNTMKQYGKQNSGKKQYKPRNPKLRF